MKQIFVTLLFFTLGQTYAFDCEKPTIYLCSRLTESAKAWNNEITKELDQEFSFFRPQDLEVNQSIASVGRDLIIYQLDLAGMEKADFLLVLPPYGRDCAWEMGWFSGKGKPAIAYTETSSDWLNDPMVKGGLTAIITSNESIYEKLVNDPAAKEKSYLVSSKKDLGRTIKAIYQLKN